MPREGAPVSEYQYYEFLAVDRPLTEREMQELRAVSSRAVITATRFTNHYEWGNFWATPAPGWRGTSTPSSTSRTGARTSSCCAFPARARSGHGETYCRGEAASARVKGEHVILEFLSEDEGSDWFEEDEDGSLSSLVPLRAEIASGDLRSLPGLAAVRASRRARRRRGGALPAGARQAQRGARGLRHVHAHRPRPPRGRGGGQLEAEETLPAETWSAGSRPCRRRRRPRCSCGSSGATSRTFAPNSSAASATPVLRPRPIRQPDGVPSASSSGPPSSALRSGDGERPSAPPASGPDRNARPPRLASAISLRWPGVRRRPGVRWRR